MTTDEIKEYIQKRIEEYDEIPIEYQDAKFKQATADLVIVLGMLDELEEMSKAKWKETNGLIMKKEKRALNMDIIKNKPSQIMSSKEALSDVKKIKWSSDVKTGKRSDKELIRSKQNE